MTVFLSQLTEELMDLVAWQQLPVHLEEEDYEKIIRRAVRRFYTDSGKRRDYEGCILSIEEYEEINGPVDLPEHTYQDDHYHHPDEEEPQDPFDEDPVEYILRDDIEADEYEYILLVAQILFFKKVQVDVNKAVSYTTNALSVTGGDKPYAHLKDTIGELQNARREMYYRMTRYTMDYDD